MARKRDVIIGINTYQEHMGILVPMFNEAGLFLKPQSEFKIAKPVEKLGVIFSDEEIAYLDKKSTKGFVGKEIRQNGCKFVVFPPMVKSDNSEDRYEYNFDTKKFTAALQLLSAVDTMSFDVRIINTKDDLKLAISTVKKWRQVFIDFETKFLNPQQKGAKILSFSASDGKVAYVMAMEHDDSPWKGDLTSQNLWLKTAYDRPEIIAHNAKFEMRWLHSRGFDFKVFHWDTMQVDHLLDERRGHGLDQLASRYTDYSGYHLAFEGTLKSKNDYESAPMDELLRYNGLDTVITALCYQKQYNELKSDVQLYNYWLTLTREFIPMVAEMEDNGFTVDVPKLLDTGEWYKNVIEQEQEKIKSMPICVSYFTDRPDFNFNSYPQMRDFLYEHLKFKKRRFTDPSPANPEGNPSTDEEAILQMRLDNKHHDILNSLARRNKAATMVKSFINVYADRVMESVDGRIRTNFNIHVVETGRLSSSKPNMQNMPTSEALKKLDFLPMKALFKSRFTGGLMLSADESQVELRIAALYSRDKAFMSAFKEGRDLHGELAEKIYGPEWDKDQRTKAKRTNFSAIFDISPKTLAENLSCPEDEARMMLREFRALHPELYAWFDEIWEKAKIDGYIVNMNGRKRHIAEELKEAMETLNTRDAENKLESVKRQTWNFPIQSTAAEITLYSTYLLWKKLKDENMKSIIVGNVHDSVVVDVSASERGKVKEMVKDIFHGIDKIWNWIDVPLKTDISIGTNLDETLAV